jgi:two-component sensor histidine kinase
MMNKYLFVKTLFLFCFSFLSNPSFAYYSNQDSLELAINSIKDPRECLFTIEDELPTYLRKRDIEGKDFLFKKGFELANQLQADTSLAYLYLHKGTDEYYYGNYIQSKEYYQLAIDKYQSIIDDIKTIRVKINEANAYNNLGIICKKQGLYSVALMNYQIALSIRKSTNDSVQIANTYLNIGNLYNTQRNTIKSKEYYLKARNTYLNAGNDYGLASANHNLGLIHELLKEYDEALEAYHQSYKMYLRLDRKKTMGLALNNIGNIYLILNEYDSVKTYLDSAFTVFSEMDDSVGICNVYMNYGNYYSQTSDAKKAESYLLDAMTIANNQVLIEKEASTAEILSAHYKNQGNYQLAYKYLAMVDSLENEFKSEDDEERFQRLDQYYREEAESQSMAIKELELKNSQNTLRNNRIFTFVLFISLLIIISLLAFLYKRFKITTSIKRELEDTNSKLKQINREYRKTLISKEEKEVLLQEIHHRVKNNLQIINSLLRFQAMKGNDETRELILELQTRITAMALLHEQLYMNKDFTKINVSDYVELLMSNLSSAYARSYTIEIKQEINIKNLDLDTLHPLGLLINEIASNSLKHAFNEDLGSCKIYIKLSNDNHSCYLEIGDNGIGFDETLLMENSSNLGIELIASLINQLEGKMETIADKGTHYKITFPCKSEVNETSHQ